MTRRHQRQSEERSCHQSCGFAFPRLLAAEPPVGQVTWALHFSLRVLPIWQLTLLQGVGPRVAESGLGLIADYPWSGPYEDVKLKAK